MRKTGKILSMLLVLMLAGSDIAFSKHVSSHAVSDFGSCSFCFQHGGSDTAIPPKVCTLFLQPASFKFKPNLGSSPLLQVMSHDHMSRAPPALT